MNEYSYQTLNVYKDAKALVIEIYRLLKQYPAEEHYAICDQIRRAAISITFNIAEGMSRYSDKEKVHFLEIAYGSLREVDCQIDIAYDLGYVTADEMGVVAEQIEKVSALLAGLRRKRLGKMLEG